MTQKFKTFAFAIVLFCFGFSSFANAQLPEDVRDVFESLLLDLDDDIAKKFRIAIKNNTATVEFSPDEFRRFRDHPVNPFDGLDQINPDANVGNIALKFELPSLRNRSVHQYERQNDSLKQRLNPVVGSAAASTVRFFNDRKQIALGIVVRANGLIITKASEIENEVDVTCHLADGRSVPVKIVKVDKANDIALVSVEADGLTTVNWSNNQPILGAFVLTPDLNGTVLGLGSYSVPPRTTMMGRQAFLGVQPKTTPNGVQVFDITRGNASYEAGLRDGDIITKMGNTPIKEVSDLVNQIRTRSPGESVIIEYLRNGSRNSLSATLDGRRMSGERAARFKMMNRLGTVPSHRNDGFPSVFQHDTPLFPEQCGGPIVDLDGNVLGMNIARNGRAASYAVPANHVQTILEQLLRSSVAARSTKSIQN